MKTGVQRTYNYLKGLDSGFRRNDRKAYLQTFYEAIIIDFRQNGVRLFHYVSAFDDLARK